MPRPAVLAAASALATLTLLAAAPAMASDACKVLLCLAAPSWRDISECVPPVRRALRDLAMGKPFPVCDMAGSGSSTRHEPAVAPEFCPPQYTFLLELESGYRPECSYAGAITVTVDNRVFTRTWWSPSGDAVTDFSRRAKSQLGSWDGRFDADYAAWLANEVGIELSQLLDYFGISELGEIPAADFQRVMRALAKRRHAA